MKWHDYFIIFSQFDMKLIKLYKRKKFYGML